MDAEYNHQIKVECLSSSVLAACIMTMFAEPPDHVVGMNKREGQPLKTSFASVLEALK